MKLPSGAPSVLLALLLAVAAVLLVAGLDERVLWEDEAENALLAQRILATGLPMARDGVHAISQGCSAEADENYLWTYHPWLPMYLTAASFKALGVSTWTARLPFAILGWLSVLSAYLVACRLFRDRTTGLLAAAFLTCSVPFLLHARQSRYYAITMVAAAWMIDAFVGALAGRRRAVIGLVVASTLMFHANHPMFAATFVGLVVGAVLVLRVPPRALAWPVAAATLTLALNFAWVLIYGRGWLVAFADPGPRPTLPARVAALAEHAYAYLVRTDVHALPLLLLAAFAGWLAWEGRDALRTPAFRMALFLLVSSAVFLACLSVLPFHFFRFMVSVLPAFAMVQAYVVRTVGRRRIVVAVVLAVLLVTTDVFHGWTALAADKLRFSRRSVGSVLTHYLAEITSDFTGPMETLVTRLRREARPTDTVFISYGDLPVHFYTGLRVYGGQSCEPLPPLPPDWVVVRYFLRFPNPAPGSVEAVARMRHYVQHELPWNRYGSATLPVADITWDSIPEPAFHFFAMPPHGPKLMLWKRLR